MAAKGSPGVKGAGEKLPGFALVLHSQRHHPCCKDRKVTVLTSGATAGSGGSGVLPLAERRQPG